MRRGAQGHREHRRGAAIGAKDDVLQRHASHLAESTQDALLHRVTRVYVIFLGVAVEQRLRQHAGVLA